MSRRFRPPVFRENFTRVKDAGREGTITAVLSAQVLVEWDDGKEGFLMNADYGNEWNVIGEQT